MHTEESAYVIDMISDGRQLYESDVVAEGQPDDLFHRIVASTLRDTAEDGDPREITVRLIQRGTVLREATIFRGEVLAEL